MKLPQSKIPENGFYYHYKHDPKGAVQHYAYEVIGVGVHTEEDCRPEDAQMVVYRPLYEDAPVYTAGKFFDLRPLTMWMGMVTKDGRTFPRFTPISDPQIIAELQVIRERMYGGNQ